MKKFKERDLILASIGFSVAALIFLLFLRGRFNPLSPLENQTLFIIENQRG
jgi:hypothetical protein